MTTEELLRREAEGVPADLGSGPLFVSKYRRSKNKRLWHVIMLVTEIISLGALSLVVPYVGVAIFVLVIWHAAAIMSLSGLDLIEIASRIRENRGYER